jgi:integrase
MAYTPKWYVSVRVATPGGRKLVTRAVSPHKAEAIAEERRLLCERDQGAVVRTGVKTDFASAAAAFLRWVDTQEQQGRLSSDTIRPYRYRLKGHLAPFFAGHDIKHIDYDAADSYVYKRQEDGAAPATINRELATLKKLLAVCVQKKIITQHALAGYSLLPEDNESDRYLSEGEILELLGECCEPQYPEHLHPIVLLALTTGLRRAGCLSLKWEEIDWKKREIVKRVKGKKLVRIPMNATLRMELAEWKVRGKIIRTHGPVFPSPVTGQPMLVTSQFGFETACKAVGLGDITFHCLRHTFATHFLEQHPDQIETLRDLMGHSGAYMTRRYSHITDRSRHAAMESFKIGEA